MKRQMYEDINIDNYSSKKSGLEIFFFLLFVGIIFDIRLFVSRLLLKTFFDVDNCQWNTIVKKLSEDSKVESL